MTHGDAWESGARSLALSTALTLDGAREYLGALSAIGLKLGDSMKIAAYCIANSVHPNDLIDTLKALTVFKSSPVGVGEHDRSNNGRG